MNQIADQKLLKAWIAAKHRAQLKITAKQSQKTVVFVWKCQGTKAIRKYGH